MDGDLFIYVAATGIAYCDRSRTVDGDWPRVAFIPFSTLEPEVADDCPEGLRPRVEAHAASLLARRGQAQTVSTSGQTVILGHALPRVPA